MTKVAALSASVLVFFFLGSSSAEQKQQTSFGVEEPFQHPVPLPKKALESMNAVAQSAAELKSCADAEGVNERDIPNNRFMASEVSLSERPLSGLVVRGQGSCFLGAHVTQFWVISKKAENYRTLFTARADQLNILKTVTNGFHDLQLVFVMEAGASIEYVTFHYKDGGYHVFRRITKRSH